MDGWLTAFWATPQMTVGHLLFTLGCTVYILVAIQMEERDLVDLHGDEYEAYQERVPMLVPFSKSVRGVAAPSDSAAAAES